MIDHKPRWCDPWCGREECVHRDAMWDRRDPWNRTTAMIHRQVNAPLFRFIVNSVVGAFFAFSLWGIFHGF